jgi:hypothetical protein
MRIDDFFQFCEIGSRCSAFQIDHAPDLLVTIA